MPRRFRRTIIMLIWAALLLAAGPAIGYAQGAGDYLGMQAAASDQQADVSAYEPMGGDLPSDVGDEAN